MHVKTQSESTPFRQIAVPGCSRENTKEKRRKKSHFVHGEEFFNSIRSYSGPLR